MASTSQRRASSWLPGSSQSWPSADVLLRSLSRLNLPPISRVVPSPPASWTTLLPRQWPPSMLGNININLLNPSRHSAGMKGNRRSPVDSLTSFDSCLSDQGPPVFFGRPSFGRYGHHRDDADDDVDDAVSSASSYSSYSKIMRFLSVLIAPRAPCIHLVIP